jgi:predicted acyltransferase
MQLPHYTSHMKRNFLAVAAILFIAAGELWNLSFPINKNLWTSSYVLFAAGCSLLGLAVSYWLVDIRKVQNGSKWGSALLWPWLVLGSNAIVIYALSDFLVEILAWIRVQDNSKSITAGAWIYLHGFARGQSTEITSVAFALVFTLVCFVPNWLLWRKRIFIKI